MAESRLYTIPGGVQAEAKKALAWRKEHKRGGTPVGLNTARTLAKGGQIGIEKVRHIAKYFPRHEVDKKGKGWKPGEDKFPSNGRIAWALWGGDAGQRWASAIVERENKKKATTAGGGAYGFVEQEQSDELDAFKMAHELDPYLGPEFMARVRLDNSGIDRLYKVEVDGQVYLWDGSGWDNMGHVDGDVYSYDKALDELGDMVEKTHVIIDPSSAIIISAFLQERPFQPVTLDEIDPEETALMQEGIFDEDFSTIDMVMTAAGEAPASAPAPKEKKGLTDGDGEFTPDERSELAKKQPRDATGLFVKVGSRTVVAGDKERGSGVLESIDYKNGKVNVRLDSGNLISVDPKYTDKEENVKTPTPAMMPDSKTPAMKTDGILGKAKRSDALNKATLPAGTKAIGPGDVQNLLSEWTKDLSESRKKATVETSAPASKSETDAEGNYEVKKGDSLWAIAEKTKAEGQSTEDQWLKIMAANKGKLKSGDPNLIFAGEKVAIPGRSGASAQEGMRKDKQDTARTDDAAKKKAAADQERIRNAKQGESRDSKNVQEAMRKDKQEVSKAEADKNKAAADQEKLRNARNADRLDTTTKNKAKAEADARAGMQGDKKAISDAEAAKKKAAADQEKLRNARNADRTDVTAKAKAKAAADAKAGMQADKKAISDAEAAKKKAAADQEKLRNARNADRVDTTEKTKAKAAADAKAGMQADKKAISDAEAAKKKASADQEKLRNARNADRADTTSKNKAKAEADARAGMQADKKAISTSEAKAAADAKAKAGVQADKKASATAETARAKAAADDKARSGVQADKKSTLEYEKAALASERAAIDREKAKEALERSRDLPAGSTARREADLAFKEADLKYRRAVEAQDKTRTGMAKDKQQISKDAAAEAARSKAKSGVQSANKAESPGITETVKQNTSDAARSGLAQSKKEDQPTIKSAQVSNARKKLEDRKNYLRGQRQKYGTYEERVRAAKERNNPINKLSGGDK